MTRSTAGDTDAELLRQPIGYLTGAAHEAVIRFIGVEHGRLGVTQRHGMTLNALAKSNSGLTSQEVTDELRQYMTSNIGDVSTYPTVLADLLDRQWISADAVGRLTLTDQGHAERARIAVRADEIGVLLQDGIEDEEYIVAIRVLQRVIINAQVT